MAVVTQLIRSEEDGSISFGNHILNEKAKLEDFNHQGDLYKVKTYKAMTKLEKNGMFSYESVPGTSVNHFKETAEEVSFLVEGVEDAQITVGLEEGADYAVCIGASHSEKMNTGLSGKLNFSVEFIDDKPVEVKICK